MSTLFIGIFLGFYFLSLPGVLLRICEQEEQILPAIWEEPRRHHSRQRMELPASVWLSMQCPLQISPITKPLVCYSHTAVPHASYMLHCAVRLPKICPFPFGLPTPTREKSSSDPPGLPPLTTYLVYIHCTQWLKCNRTWGTQFPHLQFLLKGIPPPKSTKGRRGTQRGTQGYAANYILVIQLAIL